MSDNEIKLEDLNGPASDKDFIDPLSDILTVDRPVELIQCVNECRGRPRMKLARLFFRYPGVNRPLCPTDPQSRVSRFLDKIDKFAVDL